MKTTELTKPEDIIEFLRTCDDAYFNTDDTKISDSEYDRLKRQAFNMDPSNEYFVKIGSDTRGGKIKLPYPMGSLNQIYENEYQDWIQKYDLGDNDIVVTEKLDGASCLLIYNNGTFSIAYSRGNGLEGADITRHIKHVKTIPMNVGIDYLVVRAETIMKVSTFNSKYSDQYKNPRNMVSGVVNRKENTNEILDDIDVVAYEVVASSDGIEKLNKSESLKWLSQNGFTVCDFIIEESKNLNDTRMSQLLTEFRASSEYELDGIVLTVDKISDVKKLSSSSSLNPEHSVKYKVLSADDIVEASVVDVIWNVSKGALLKPRIMIVPETICGTTVTYATGFNAKYINDNKIGKGSKIKITKSGMVIPYVISVVKPTTPRLPDINEFGEWEWNDTGVEIVLKDRDSDIVIFKQVLDFFETYKVDQLREATLNSVWKYISDKTYTGAIVEICGLTEIEWINIVGVNGSKIYHSLINRLGNSHAETFYGACKFMGSGFGVRKAKALLDGIQDVRDDVLALTIDDIVAKDGFDTKTATNVVSGIQDSVDLMDELVNLGVLNFIQQETTNELSGVNVVMTGFRDEELQYTIESMGGKVSSGVSKKTTHLLCMDVDSKSTKMQKARQLNIEIMTPEDFKIFYGI